MKSIFNKPAGPPQKLREPLIVVNLFESCRRHVNVRGSFTCSRPLYSDLRRRYGVTQRLSLERWYREMRIRRIGEGPSEVQRHIIARDILWSEFAAVLVVVEVK